MTGKVQHMTTTPAPLIDLHAHFVTDAYVQAASAAGYGCPDGMSHWPSWSPEAHLELMDACGIATSMLSMSSPGTHFGDDGASRALTREVNEYGAELVRAHPGRFGHFASLPLPDVAGSLAEAAYAFDELGSHGVILMTNAHGRYLGDETFTPLWEELDRRAAVVFVHPTSPRGHEQISMGRPRPMLEFIFDTTRTVSDLVLSGTLQRHPQIKWVFTHGAGTLPLVVDRMELFRTLFGGGSPTELTVPDQVKELWFDIAGTPFPNQVPAAAAAFGSERLVYGSDYCWTPAPTAAAHVASLDAAPQPPGTTWRALTTANAKRLLPPLA
jgi:predicted TIM-barrel fold metal-dependent hydrolase